MRLSAGLQNRAYLHWTCWRGEVWAQPLHFGADLLTFQKAWAVDFACQSRGLHEKKKSSYCEHLQSLKAALRYLETFRTNPNTFPKKRLAWAFHPASRRHTSTASTVSEWSRADHSVCTGADRLERAVHYRDALLQPSCCRVWWFCQTALWQWNLNFITARQHLGSVSWQVVLVGKFSR